MPSPREVDLALCTYSGFHGGLALEEIVIEKSVRGVPKVHSVVTVESGALIQCWRILVSN